MNPGISVLHQLLIVWSAFTLVGMLWPCIRSQQESGNWMGELPSLYPLATYHTRMCLLLWVAYPLTLLLVMLYPEQILLLPLLQWPPPLRIVAWILLLLAFVLLFLSQLDWQYREQHAKRLARERFPVQVELDLGEDFRARPRSLLLLQSGSYSLSRNPQYLALRMALIGQFFLFPSSLAMAFMSLVWVLTQTQTLIEEAHLFKQYGDSWRRYCRRVRRWL